MKPNRGSKLIVFFLIAWLLIACNPPQPEQTSIPPCTADDVLAPEIISGPDNGEIITTLRPSFAWQSANDCAIKGYEIKIGNESENYVTNLLETNWTMTTDLTEATGYYWKVAAVTLDGSVGPYSFDKYFFTGPTCSLNESMTIRLDSPAAGEVISQASPELRWSYQPSQPAASLCMPEDHHFIVQNQATGQVALEGDGGGAFTSFSTPLDYLEDCQRYRWWVIPVMQGQEAVSYALTQASFSTDFSGQCPACDTSTLLAPIPLTPPDGSTWTESSPSVTWDYPQLYCLNAFEFRVEISPDPAFTPPVTHTQFPAHKFSMMFDPAAYILVDCTQYYWRVFAIQNDSDGNPLSQVSPTFSFMTDFTNSCKKDEQGDKSKSIVSRDAVCRSGPGMAYPIRLYLSSGTEVETVARNANSDWMLIQRPDGYGECWMSLAVLEIPQDAIAGLPAREAPPLPTPTPTNIASDKEDDPIATAIPTTQVCSVYSTQLACQQAGCTWLASGTHAGAGECKNP